MLIAGIDWELADKIYAREEDKILEEIQKRKQEIARDCQSRGIAGTTPCYVEIRRADIQKLDQLAKARINADWQALTKSGANITASIVDNILTRLSQTLSSHIRKSVALYDSQKEYNKAKARLIGEAKRELEIRGGLMTIEDMKKKRFQFLHKLYKMTGGDESKGILIHRVGEELELDKSLAWQIARFLSGAWLIKIETTDGVIKLTHQGILEVEEALSKPDKPTEYFPPVNIIRVGGNMVGSQIQQASPGARQTATISANKLEELKEVVESLKTSLHNLGLEPQQKSDLQAEMQTMEAQMTSSKPKRAVITASLSCIRDILAGATGSLIAYELLNKVAPLLEQMLR